MTPATAEDVREVASAVYDLAGVVRDIARDTERLDGVEKALTDIRAQLAPVRTHFDALNAEHAATIASAAEAGNRKKATLNEWLAWLTPKRAVGIIVTIGTLCGFGGPMTGLTGRMQAAYSAAMTALTTEAP